MKHIIGLTLCLFWMPALAQVKPVVISTLEAAENLPFSQAVTISRKDPKNLLVVGPGNSIYNSSDFGATWNSVNKDVSIYGTAVLLSNRKGNIYRLVLSAEQSTSSFDRIVCQQTGDGGVKWEGKGIAGLEPGKSVFSVGASIHPRTDMLYATWTQMDSGSPDSTHQSHVLFSMSKDGDKWSVPLRINQIPGDCFLNGNTVLSSAPAVTMDGRIFIVWSRSGKIYLDRSYNKGETWLMNDLPIADQTGGFNLEIPGLRGYQAAPAIVFDNSPGYYHGSLYIVWPDKRNGNDGSDIWLIRSINSGDYWTQPARIVDNPAKKHQFSPAVVVDQTSGFVYIAYYDRSNYDDLRTDVRLAWSMDGGSTFKNVTVDEGVLLPSKLSGHNAIQLDAYRGIITPVWTRMDDHGKVVFSTAIIKHEELSKEK